jgi:DNA-binding MarR family transcriptional regulator
MEMAAQFVKSWMKLSKEWNAQLAEELAPQLTMGQLQVLEILQLYEPMKPSDLLPHLETTPAAVTTLLDRMERNGLVERQRDSEDRRIVWVRMTELGKSEVDRGIGIRARVAERSLERLSQHNRQLFVYLIGKVSGLHASEAERGAEPGSRPAAGRKAGEPAEPEPVPLRS